MSGLVRVQVTEPDSIIVRPAGEIDYSSLAALRDALLDACVAGVRQIVVDMADVEFLDSQGLAAILFAFRRQRSVGGQLTLRNVSDDIKRLLALTRVAPVLPVEDPPV